MTKEELKVLGEGVGAVVAETHSLFTKLFMALAMQPSINLPVLIADVEKFRCDDDSRQTAELEGFLRLLRQLSDGSRSE